jgi:hypothetical protein
VFTSAFRIMLDGDLTEAQLDGLRAAARLARRGRYGDAWDQIQGERADEVAGGRIEVLLIRDDLGGPWELVVNLSGQPAPAAVAAVESDLVTAAAGQGVTVREVRRR